MHLICDLNNKLKNIKEYKEGTLRNSPNKQSEWDWDWNTNDWKNKPPVELKGDAERLQHCHPAAGGKALHGQEWVVLQRGSTSTIP